jgi:hypothetical protein
MVWTKRHDKLDEGVTQESHNKLWYEFAWEAIVTVNTGRGKWTETKNKAVGPGREHVSKTMSTISGGDRRGDLTS